MVRGGAARLNAKRQEINDLNVFPIPDGDTGDNMYMTIQAGCDSAGATLGEMAGAAARGMLMGARGNSGVILSRIFAGIAKGLEGKENATLKEFAAAMQAGVEESYKAVSEPVEGTILTVLREGVAGAAECADAPEGPDDILAYFDRLIPEMGKSLAHTPELLEVLARAGVVDSGGAGLVAITEGMRDALMGIEADYSDGPAAPAAHKVDLDSFTSESVLEFGYCTEFILRLQSSKVDLATFDESVISQWLAANGESLVFFREGSMIKVHVHTFTPGEILNHCQQWGEFLTIKIENMTLQHHENHMESAIPKVRKRYGVVAVATGDGMVEMFRESGADVVIEGGQTMNPPVQSFIGAFEKIGAETIFVLPDNSNILLTAQQAAAMYDKSDIRVIPCKTLGEGYYALANLDLSADSADEIERTLTEAIKEVTTGMVSRAIRDTDKVKEGDYIGISGKDILSDSPDRVVALVKLAEVLGAAGKDVIMVFTGQGVPNPGAELTRCFTDAEVIIRDGGQPVYDYLLILL